MFGKINLKGQSTNSIIKINNKKNKKNRIEQKQQNDQIEYNDRQNDTNKKKTKLIKKSKLHLKNSDSIMFNCESQSTLQSAKFRLINEHLYLSSSSQALQYFNKNLQDYQLYHRGYQNQLKKWSMNPLQYIIRFLLHKKSYYQQKNIVDLGCGQGLLQQRLKNFKNIRSFDLISCKQFIQVADIAKLPLQNQSCSVCIFCLSLMGNNYLDFIIEANRVLKCLDGQIIIAEVQSRCKQWFNFVKMIEKIGFQLLNNGIDLNRQTKKRLKNNNQEEQNNDRYFRIMHFKKTKNCIKDHLESKYFQDQGQKIGIQEYSKQILGVCLYKKR